MSARVVAVCTSEKKGVQKHAVGRALLVANSGLEGDAHAGPGKRQVSLLAEEDVDRMRALGLELAPGAFGENLLTRGLDLTGLALGTRVRLGAGAVVEITKHGKTCHTRCAIYEQAGDCIMPTRGVFARVVVGGQVEPGDPVEPEPAR